MRSYKRIATIENTRRLKKLGAYRNDVVEYFNHSQVEDLAIERVEDAAAMNARHRINMTTHEVSDIIGAAGVTTVITYTPPPASGGYRQDIDLVHNMFLLTKIDLSPQVVIDIVERAMGVYDRNTTAANWRRFNPFFYIGLALGSIASSPFLLASRIGLPGQELENSPLGVVVRLVVYTGGATASAIAILQFLGYLDEARAVVAQMTGI